MYNLCIVHVPKFYACPYTTYNDTHHHNIHVHEIQTLNSYDWALDIMTKVIPFISPFLLTVSQEGTKLIGVDVIVESDQELLVELEGRWELDHHLPHTLQELGEDWGRLAHIPRQVTIPKHKHSSMDDSHKRKVIRWNYYNAHSTLNILRNNSKYTAHGITTGYAENFAVLVLIVNGSQDNHLHY